MILPDPIVLTKPLHVWLGFIVFALVIIQMIMGVYVKKGVKSVYFYHTRLNPIFILIIGLVHGFYGFEIYFLR